MISINLSGFDTTSTSNIFSYTEKNVYSVKNNPLSGITLLPWLRILYNYGKYIDLKKYIIRVVFISLLSVFNTILAIIEYILYSRMINNVTIPDDVVFIIGHPRTGNTISTTIVYDDY